MTRRLYVWDKKLSQLVEVTPNNSENVSANIITDECDPFVSHVDGETVFTSKKKYAEHVEAAGYVQTGAPPKPWELKNNFKVDSKDLKDTVQKAYYDIKYDKVKFTEQEKERWRREERNIKKNSGY